LSSLKRESSEKRTILGYGHRGPPLWGLRDFSEITNFTLDISLNKVNIFPKILRKSFLMSYDMKRDIDAELCVGSFKFLNWAKFL
jgi:hypothetical protein